MVSVLMRLPRRVVDGEPRCPYQESSQSSKKGNHTTINQHPTLLNQQQQSVSVSLTILVSICNIEDDSTSAI